MCDAGGLPRKAAALKRTFDVLLAIAALCVAAPLILLVAALAQLDTGASGFFTQVRVGREGRLFRLIKIRTMKSMASMTTTVTTASDVRITPLGRLLRASKLDELPQLINVLRGDMSFVGPRPDVPGYADLLQGQDRIVLSVRPGITGPATLKYRDEERLLDLQPDPERYNSECIFPDKVRINREYVENYRFSHDLRLLLQTFCPRFK